MNPFKVFAGITLVFVGLTLLSLSSIPAQNVQVGGVVMIGPIPLVFGSSPAMASFALVVALVFFLFFLFAFRT